MENKRASSQGLEEGNKKGQEGMRQDGSRARGNWPAGMTHHEHSSPACANWPPPMRNQSAHQSAPGHAPARRQAVAQPSGAHSQGAATDEEEGRATRNATSSHDAPTSPSPTSSPRQGSGGGASSWTAAAREEANGREEGDAYQDGSNRACAATGRRRRRREPEPEPPVQTAADGCKNKNCHYCEHAPKRSAFFACLHPSCDQTFCENCNSRHLDAPTYFGGQDDARRAHWLCPICTRCVPPHPLTAAA